MKRRTWKVVTWGAAEGQIGDAWVPLDCRHCGNEADCPTHGKPPATPIAASGMGVIFDTDGPPVLKGWLPDEIQCRKCRRIYAL